MRVALGTGSGFRRTQRTMAQAATLAAMQLGKHVYTQKPLTHDIYEARTLAQAAKKYKVVTQMGNQGGSGDGVRQAKEMYNAGMIGDIIEAHAWTNRPVWPQGIPTPTGKFDIPKELGASHYHAWVTAALGGPKTTDGFDYAGPLTETVLLGNVATRVPNITLEWDAADLRIKNNAEADQLLKTKCRDGWAIPAVA